MTPRFHTKAGYLTPYALACGYQEVTEHGNGIIIRLYKEANGYHVRAHNHATGQRLAWNIFETVTAARWDYNRLVKAYKEN